ncbi:FAD dependent oxidoreductase/aminomethyl transferase [alpha proteobacterium BAL199]|jgi:glycine cleavage system T protein|nr:FAD dependent oxidoreductase/aminomethyl transferase [alpha proteobacterium BAL199]
MAELPKQARVVIVGGGVIGCSVAYHLTKLGWSGVLLLERKRLTSGTTWHAAGLIGQLRASFNMTRLAKYTAELYDGLEAETGIAIGYHKNGSLAVALSDQRFEEMRRAAAMAGTFGLEAHVLTPAECLDRYPLLSPDGIVGGVFLPTDGQADPANIALGLAKGARQRGATILENVKVTAIAQRNGRVTGVETEQGPVAAEYVVNCAGMWGREVGRMAGVDVPLQACEHFYIVTEPIADLPRGLPVLRVPDECAYYKEDAGKILLGAFEPNAKPWGVDGIPEDFCFDQLPEDFEHFEPILERAVKRFPLLETAGIHTFFNGPESFTPDDRYLLGEAPNLRNFFVAAGFNSIGIQSGGGAGKALAEWMEAGEPPMDLSDVDIRRMQPFQANKRYLVTRAKEALGLLYADHFPYRQFESARGVRTSALHERLAARGACFGESSGWERANWFLPPEAAARGERADYAYSWGRQNWFEYTAAEHRAVREGVGLFDMSSFAKFRVEGPDAEAVLQLVSAADVAVPVGRCAYTQWLNPRGGIEADLTVTRLSEAAFLVVTSGGAQTRDLAWLRRHVPDGARCVVTDASAAEAVISVMGPKAREVLQPLTPQSLSNEAFPFGTAQTIEIGMGLARAHRLSYVGELGWEIYVATDMARHVFDAILESGERHGLRLCGMHALDSCRIEKGYRHFGHDISGEDHVLEAGLGFAVKVDKPRSAFGDFIGRDAVLRRREQGLTHRLLQFRLTDPQPLLYHNEPILQDSKAVGRITSGNYGHWLGGAVGLGYVPCRPGESAEEVLARSYAINVAGDVWAAEASVRPMYDPTSARMRA